MTVQHAIVAFPILQFADRIESVRQRFDPLASLLGAHITLVFPFADSLTQSHLKRHIDQAVVDFAPFDFALSAPTPEADGYLFLHVTSGLERFVRLHERLYSDDLARHRSTTHSYRPHITVGHVSSPEQLITAAREASLLLGGPLVGRVDGLSMFRLDQPLSGTVVATIPFHPSPYSQSHAPGA